MYLRENIEIGETKLKREEIDQVVIDGLSKLGFLDMDGGDFITLETHSFEVNKRVILCVIWDGLKALGYHPATMRPQRFQVYDEAPDTKPVAHWEVRCERIESGLYAIDYEKVN